VATGSNLLRLQTYSGTITRGESSLPGVNPMLSLTPLLLLGALQGSEPTRVAVGEVISEVLSIDDPQAHGAPAGLRFELVVEEPGPVTIELASHDFDAHLRVEDDTGKLLAEDDNSGIETDARVVLMLESSTSLLLIVTAREGAGQFALSVDPGEHPIPTGPTLLDAGIEWRRTAAERALERGDEHLAALHHLAEGNHASALARYDDARRAFQVTLDIARRLGTRRTEAAAFGNLAKTYLDAQDFARARELYKQWLELAREIEDRPKEAKAQGGLGILSLYLGDFAQAREHFEEELALTREIGDRVQQLGAQGNLANVCFYLGRHEEARHGYEDALELSREVGNRISEGISLANLGAICTAQSEYADAREYFEQALYLYRQIGERAAQASALGNLGVVAISLGDFSAAREYQEQALALAREFHDRRDEAAASSNLGNVYYQTGEYATAREHYERGLALSRELGDRAQEAGDLGRLGMVEKALGNSTLALGLLEQNLATLRELGDRSLEVNVLGNIGTVHLDLGDYDRALDFLEEAIELARELGDLSSEEWVLGNLGNIHRYQGDLEAAQELYELQLELARRIGDSHGEAIALSNHAEVEFGRKNYERSRHLAREAERVATQIGASGRLTTAHLIIACASIALSDTEQALVAIAAAEEALEQVSHGGLDSREASGLRGSHAQLGHAIQDLTALRLSESASDPADRRPIVGWGFAAAGRWKGRALLEGIAEHRAGGRTAEAIDLRRQRREARAAYGAALARVSEAIVGERSGAQVDALRREASAHQAEADRLALRLRTVSPQDAALDLPLGVGPDRVQREVLRPGELLVEYVQGQERLYAYVLGEDTQEFLDLGPRQEIAREVESFLLGLRGPGHLASVAEVARGGRALHDRLLAQPMKATDAPIERLLIVPSAELSALPFEALVIETASGSPTGFDELTFVLERHEISYGPSTPVLIELASAPERSSEGSLLVLADPLYASAPAAPSPTAALARARPHAASLTRLPGTRAEAIAIAHSVLGTVEPVLPDGRSGSFEHGRLELHLGARASRTHLQGNLRDFSVLHLACHGFIDAAHPQRTGIALSPTAADDGWFTIGQALELDLDCDLVVLSACQTARGEVRAGEGVESLARAFLYAGARGLIASLWQVDDLAAGRTMADFYASWLREGHAPAHALRAAKLALRRSEVGLGPERGVSLEAQALNRSLAADPGHPFYWAPFVHVGLR